MCCMDVDSTSNYHGGELAPIEEDEALDLDMDGHAEQKETDLVFHGSELYFFGLNFPGVSTAFRLCQKLTLGNTSLEIYHALA